MYHQEYRRCSLLLCLVMLMSQLSFSSATAQPVGRGGQDPQVISQTKYSRTVRNSDGSETLHVFTSPTFFETTGGGWAPIDPTLVYDSEKATWHTRASDMAVQLQSNSLGSSQTMMASLSYGHQSLAFSLKDAESAPLHVAERTAVYTNVFEGVDLRYDLGANHLQESLILRHAPKKTSFQFILRVSGGTPVLLPDGSIRVNPCADECVTVLAPYMQDARGAVSEGVQVDLRAGEQGDYLLSYTPDADWLSRPERTYPVVLDPSVTVGASQSLYVQERYPTTATCNSQRMLAVGYDPAGDLGGYGKLRTRGFVKLDLSALPSNATVTGATFRAWQYYLPPGASGYSVNLQRVASEWASHCMDITWNNQPSVDGAVQSNRWVDTAIGWKDWNITELLQQWRSGTPNYGLALLASDESRVGSFFCSSVATGTQCGSNSDQLHPYAEITYTTPSPTNPSPTPPPSVVHTGTQIRGAVENGKTTLWLKICGQGPRYRFRTLWLNTNQVLWDRTYGAVNGCTPEYRAVVDANPGETYRFYSTVMDAPISDSEFLQRRRDACHVNAPGNISCKQGDTPPGPPIPPIADPPPPAPLKPCEVPYFSQIDPAWKGNRLGGCGGVCATIGGCGCTLTSAAMVFRFFGADTNPGKLASCMGNYACPLYWAIGSQRCSEGRATWVQQVGFSWGRLEHELNNEHRPVIIGMARGANTHFVVAVKGQGNNAASYTINDPGVLDGRSAKLSSYTSRGWSLGTISIYKGSLPSGCSGPAAAQPQLASSPRQGLGTTSAVSIGSSQPEPVIQTTGTLTGSITVYSMTETLVTLQLDAQSPTGAVKEMLIKSDTFPNTTWQPYTRYVRLPALNAISVTYRDASGATVEIRRGSPAPEQSPPDGFTGFQVYVPRVVRR